MSHPDDLHQQERDLTAALQRAADAPIPKCSPGRRHRHRLVFYNEDFREHNPTESTCTESCINDSPTPPTCGCCRFVVTRARQGVSAGQGGQVGWSGALLQPAHLPRPVCGGMSGRLPVPPRMGTGRPPHTHTRGGRRDSWAGFPARGSSAQLPLRTRHLQQTSFDNTGGRLSGKREGNLMWRTTSLLARNCRRRGKKGATQLQGRTA
ncbi:hypothetical protein GWK47_044159 [Chionoecetes opilio]|uniref:Uncharacterized protein n=1 Tax=Chionoecetes opilio TaxID=41210 RepID=A0A8J4YJH4_CHIOP|nr:hypothetical protein GWK47_044159 [Chionoecetes opilio]